MTALTLQEQVLAAAAQQAQLLQAISDNNYAVAACQQNQKYIETLIANIIKQRKALDELSSITASEYADHKKYRDSHMMRLAYRLGGKKEIFEEQASKEEQHWLRAIQEEFKAKRSLKS